MRHGRPVHFLVGRAPPIMMGIVHLNFKRRSLTCRRSPAKKLPLWPCQQVALQSGKPEPGSDFPIIKLVRVRVTAMLPL